jgi:hypothetical protein
MSDKRRRRSGSGDNRERSSPAKKAGIIAAWVLGLFLAANLAVAVLRKDETGRPSGLVTEDAVAAAALWVPLVVFGGAAAVGAWAGWRAWQRSERATSLWTMRAFIVSLVLCLGIAVGVFELERRWFAVAAVLAFAIQTTLFAIAATRESRHHGGGHAHRPGTPALPAQPDEARATASGDFARDESGDYHAATGGHESGGQARPESTS